MTVLLRDQSFRVDLTAAGVGQWFLVASNWRATDPGNAARTLYRVLARALRQAQAEIVHERIFANLSVQAPVLKERHTALATRGINSGPLTYIEGAPPAGEGLAGVIIQAVAPAATDDGVRTFSGAGELAGRRWRRSAAQHVVLQSVDGLARAGGESDNSPAAQTARLLQRVQQAVVAQGMSLSDVVRTWFYLDNIIDWYDAFNALRSRSYRGHGLLLGGTSQPLLPASTGIGARNPRGAAAVVDVLAIGGAGATRLANVAQPEPASYGSAFSRAVVTPEHEATLVRVSGTAAIGGAGESLHPADALAQIECTFDKLDRLLAPTGATLHDVAAASVFVKRGAHAATLASWAEQHRLPDFPRVVVVADVCREELVFEVDADVVVAEAMRTGG